LLIFNAEFFSFHDFSTEIEKFKVSVYCNTGLF